MEIEDNFIVACDLCELGFPTEELVWEDGGEVLCLSCIELQVPLEVPKEEPILDLVPFFIFYSKGNEILHISSDISSPKQWKDIQGNNWWWYDIDYIKVKFATTKRKADTLINELQVRVAPLYMSKPTEKDLSKKLDPEITDIDESLNVTTKASILNVRVTPEIDFLLTQKTHALGVERADYIRHLLASDLQADL